MSRITILPEDTANRIAAGEVVERPASVVKELVENGIDAGAGQIDVQIEGNGSRLIRITDDGEGMDQDDVLLSLERHATSKLTAAGDLTHIRTLGFRGEAIPSISSVARLTMTSRAAGASLGTRVEIRYGKIVKIHDMGCGFGTSMEIRDLFGNVPARRKFLKSPRTELSHIEEVVRNYGFSYPAIGFSLELNNQQIFSLQAGCDSAEQRARLLLDRKNDQLLIPINSDHPPAAEGRELSVSGFLLPPDELLGKNNRLRIFVNGRFIKDRLIQYAVSEAMQGFLMRGARPAGVLFLAIDPELIDINVHPAKYEIRFQQPAPVRDLVIAAVRNGLLRFQQQIKSVVFSMPVPSTAADDDVAAAEPEAAFSVQEPARPVRSHQQSLAFADPIPNDFPRQSDFHSGREDCPVGNNASSHPVVKGSGEEAGGRFVYLGQLLDSYLLCQTSAGLVVIDQHAAHERLLFEKLKQQWAHQGLARQNLLFPSMIELSAAEARILRDNFPHLEKLGITVEEFGDNSFIIKAVPAVLKHLPPREVVAGILADLAADSSGPVKNSARGIDDVVSGIACKAAIRAGDSLHDEEAEELLRQMQQADIFSHCPHGRPTSRTFSPGEIKKWFHRT